MPSVTFFPSDKRHWETHPLESGCVHVTGWCYYQSKYLESDCLASLFGAVKSLEQLSKLLSAMNGNFAVVIEHNDQCFLGADHIRSIPITYRSKDNAWLVSDDVDNILGADETPSQHSVIEYATAGFVTGPNTLYVNVYGVQSGECVSLEDDTTDKIRYYEYKCSYDSSSNIESICQSFDQTLEKVFENLIESLRGRQAVIPLSGGLDSRLIASFFKRFGYRHVKCISYGLKDNIDSQKSRQIANKLGFDWQFIPYTKNVWKSALTSKALKQYWEFSSNAIASPHCDDWPALRLLTQSADIEADAVMIPGHTGDFISGGHLKYVFEVSNQHSALDIHTALIKKHYSLWRHLLLDKQIVRQISERIEHTLSGMPKESDNQIAGCYEYWEWQERQAKFVINSVRSYEFFGFSWKIPLWDQAVMAFWQSVPRSLKLEKYLYRTYLNQYDPFSLYKDDGPKPANGGQDVLARRGKIKTLIRSADLLKPLLNLYTEHQQHWHNYKIHPLGMATHYGLFRYVFGEKNKRHTQSLVVKDSLKYFGIPFP